MTPLSKRRLSSRRQGKRRASIHLKLPTLISCPECHQPTRPHQVCGNCGTYKGKKVGK